VTADRARGAVLITGASPRIGAACALHLDRVGFRVWPGVRRSSDGAALVGQASRRLTPVILDVTDSNSIATALAGVGADGLAGLVNNAGIVVAAPVEVLPIAELRKQLEVNVIGLVAVTQAALPLLRRGHGRVVNIGSISGRIATPVIGAYAASKFAVEALTDALRIEVQPWGIDVALIEPGAVATPIWEKSQAAGLALRQAWTPDAEGLYADALSAVERAALRSAKQAISPDAVARAVAHALTATRPKTRYLVGTAARIQAIVALLPDRLRDRFLTRALGLPSPRAKR
jgi:NAD(P)-dependent dehydrogenase (short-subunit alcohol dehydrogenase family)